MEEQKDTIGIFLKTYYQTLPESIKKRYETALIRYSTKKEIIKSNIPISVFSEYKQFCESLEDVAIKVEDIKEYICSFVATINVKDSTRVTYRSGLLYHLRYGSFGNYRISPSLWESFIRFSENEPKIKESILPEVVKLPSIPKESKDELDKRAKEFLESYRIRGKKLYKEIKFDILLFIKRYLYGNYEKDYARINSLTWSKREVFEQYKTVILSFMNTYKPKQDRKIDNDITGKIHSIQTQIRSLNSVICSLNKELERLSEDLGTLLSQGDKL